MLQTLIWDKTGKDTDEVVEAQQGADDFFVCFHDDVNSGADAFVHEL